MEKAQPALLNWARTGALKKRKEGGRDILWSPACLRSLAFRRQGRVRFFFLQLSLFSVSLL